MLNLARLSKTLQEILLKKVDLSLSNSEVTLIAGRGKEKEEGIVGFSVSRDGDDGGKVILAGGDGSKELGLVVIESTIDPLSGLETQSLLLFSLLRERE